MCMRFLAFLVMLFAFGISGCMGRSNKVVLPQPQSLEQEFSTFQPPAIKPIVINHCGYPAYPKDHIPESAELICFYSNPNLQRQLGVMLKNSKHPYIELCRDHNSISFAWCRLSKHKEFTERLKTYEV